MAIVNHNRTWAGFVAWGKHLAFAAICWLGFSASASAAALGPWQQDLLASLCGKYLNAVSPARAAATEQARLDALVRALGERLAQGGLSAVPAEDLAAAALLQSTLSRTAETPSLPAANGVVRNASLQVASAASPAAPQQLPTAAPAQDPMEASDYTKGQEGIRQAQERLAELPLTERLVLTGDVASVVQGAVVPGSTDLASTSGRVRFNFVMRAISGDPARMVGDGYFFLQMRAAGGAFDSSPVGGPASFSAINDIATDRSSFNESTSRGNLYLSKAYFQQSLALGSSHLLARVGIINLSDDFDSNRFANNESRQFLNASLVNSTAYKTGLSAPGLAVTYQPGYERDWLTGVVLRGGYAVSRTERAFTSPVWSGEVELQTRLRGRDGHWRFGATAGNRAGVGSIRGFYLNFDHWLTSNLGVFGRYGLSNSSPGSLSFGPARQSYSGGVQRRFIDAEERVSAWSLGFSQTFGIPTGAEELASERVLETYYRWQWSQNISLTPDLQLVFGSGGRRSNATQPVFGLRLNFGF